MGRTPPLAADSRGRAPAKIRFVSSRRQAPAVDLRAALFDGLAPDGGLYMPEPLVPMPTERLQRLRGADLRPMAVGVAEHLLGAELGHETIVRLVDQALDFPMPLVHLEPGLFVLELFHGPTLAFKDVGARFMARLMALYHGPRARPLTMLVATSGDTGSAVAHAFLGLDNTCTVILFPHGLVSDIQERQFSTLGGNVHAVAIDGTFDDCQRLVKQVFGDAELRCQLSLTSANSINIGRLLPQMFFYFHAWAQLAADCDEVVFATPSGNFGNLAAGLMAKRIGLPAAVFVGATNANDVVPEYLETGHLRPRPSLSTISNAMDVGNPSNIERIVALYGDDLDRLRGDLVGSRHTDDQTRACIARVAQRHDYVLDPHSAVGYLGLEEELARRPGATGVLLATAHPAKFVDTVQPQLRQPLAIPETLTACLTRERHIVRLPPKLEDLQQLLLGL